MHFSTLYLSPSLNATQNGQELSNVQAVVKGRRVHLLLEAVHRLGLSYR